MDVLASQIVTEYIAILRDQGKAVIISTHHLDEAQRLCDRFGLLHQGRIVLEGTLAQLQDRTGVNSLVEIFLQLARTRIAGAPPADSAARSETRHVAADS